MFLEIRLGSMCLGPGGATPPSLLLWSKATTGCGRYSPWGMVLPLTASLETSLGAARTMHWAVFARLPARVGRRQMSLCCEVARPWPPRLAAHRPLLGPQTRPLSSVRPCGRADALGGGGRGGLCGRLDRVGHEAVDQGRAAGATDLVGAATDALAISSASDSTGRRPRPTGEVGVEASVGQPSAGRWGVMTKRHDDDGDDSGGDRGKMSDADSSRFRAMVARCIFCWGAEIART